MNDEPEPPLHQRRIWEFQALRDVCVIVGILAVLWLGARLSFITAPLLFGLALAYLFEPAIALLCRRFKGMTRPRAVLALAASVFVAGVLLLVLVIPPLVHQAVNLAGNSGRYLASAQTWIASPDSPAWLRKRAAELSGLLSGLGLSGPAEKLSASPPADPPPAASGGLDEERVRQLVREELARSGSPAKSSDLVARVKAAAGALWTGAAAVFGTTFSVGLFIVIALFTAVSCMLRWPELQELGCSLIPNRARERVLPLVTRMDSTVSSFMRGRFTVAALVGVIYAVGWTIVGVPYGLVLGLVVGACSIVPYLAAAGLPVAWLLLTLSLMADPGQGGWYVTKLPDGGTTITWWLVLVLPLAVNFIAQILEDYVLNPLIQGKATDLHPVLIMLAVLAGGSLAGLYGMLLAVPVAACLKIVLVVEIMPRLRTWAGAET